MANSYTSRISTLISIIDSAMTALRKAGGQSGSMYKMLTNLATFLVEYKSSIESVEEDEKIEKEVAALEVFINSYVQIREA